MKQAKNWRGDTVQFIALNFCVTFKNAQQQP